MADYEISAEIKADSSGFSAEVKKAQKSMQGFSSKLKDFSKSMSGGVLTGNLMHDALKLVTKGIKAGIDTVKKGVKEYEKFVKEQKLLAQTLKVTGAETWTTVESLNAYADALQETTNYSSGEISQLQTVLLGFKNITGENFNKATDAILDMASVMNMDLTSATQAVAKALDDPIKGINSLSRQGFIFTEQQKEQLAAMVEVGDIASAQKIILGELETTYGGAAKASAKATTQLKNTWNDLLEQVGRNVVIDFDIEPATEKLNTLVKKWKDALEEMADIKEKTDKLIAAEEAVESGKATEEQKVVVLEREIEKVQILLMQYKEMVKVETDPVIVNNYKKIIQEYTVQEGQLKAQLKVHREIIDAENKKIQAQKDLLNKEKEKEERDAQANRYIEEYNKKISEQKKEWEAIEAVTGQRVTDEDQLVFYQNELVRLLTSSKGLITENNSFYKEQLELVKQIEAQVDAIVKKELLEKENIKNAFDTIKQDIEKTAEDTKNTIEGYIAELSEKAEDAFNFDWDKLSGLNSFFKDIGKFIDNNIKNKIQGLLSEAKKVGEGAKNQISQITNKATQDISKIKDQMNAGLIDSTQAKSKIEEIKSNASEAIKVVYLETGMAVEKIGKKIKSLMVAQTILHLSAQVISIVSANVKGVIKGIETAVKYGVKAVKEAFNIIKKIVDFSFDEFIDKMLKFEDKLLTFIIDMKNAVPQFISTVLSSIGTTLESIDQYLTTENVKTMIFNLLTTISKKLPAILKTSASIISKILMGFVTAISDWLDDGGFEELLNGLLEFQKDLEDAVVKALKVLVEVIKKSMPQILKFLKESIISASETLAELVPIIVDIIIELVKLIIKILTDKDIMKSSIGVIKALIKAIFEQIIPAIFEIISEDGINIISIGFEIGLDLIKGIIEALFKMDWGSVFSSIFSSIGSSVTSGSFWGGVGNFLLGGLPNLFGWWATGTNNAPRGLSIVGEEGPELIDLHGGERIYNAKNTRAILNGDGGNVGNTMNITFNNLKDTTASAMMSQLKYYDRQLAVNGF